MRNFFCVRNESNSISDAAGNGVTRTEKGVRSVRKNKIFSFLFYFQGKI